MIPIAVPYVKITFPIWKWNGIINEGTGKILSIIPPAELVPNGGSSVEDPGCLSRIPDPTFFHPGSEFFPSRIPDPQQRI